MAGKCAADGLGKESMRYCIYGLGAIGGQIAARLARAGATVSGVARNDTLAAIRERGIGLRENRGAPIAWQPIEVAERLTDLPPADCVVVAVKTTALPAIADDLAAGLPAHRSIVTAMNGVPWWFFDGFGGRMRDHRLHSVDPGGRLASAFPARRVIGAAIHLSGFTPAPGEIVRTSGNRIVIGAADPASRAAHAGALRSDLREAGFDVEVSPDIRRDIWFKLYGNVSLNPASVLTRMPVDRILGDPLARDFVARCVTEANAIGRAIGLGIDQSADERLESTARLGSFKPSMLQDAEAGRPIELDALLTSVREIGAALGVPSPNIDALLGLCRLHGEANGLYHRR